MSYKFLGIAKSRVVEGRHLFLDAPRVSKEQQPVAVLYDPDGGQAKEGWIWACSLNSLQELEAGEIPESTWNNAHWELLDAHAKILNGALTVELLPTTRQVAEVNGLGKLMDRMERSMLSDMLSPLTHPLNTLLKKVGLKKPQP